MDKREEKKILRRQLSERAKGISPERLKEASVRICRSIIQLPQYQQAQSVFCFVSMRGELDTIELLQDVLEQGKQLVVPRVTGPGTMMLHLVTSLADLTPSRMGIPEPDASAPAVEANQIDLSIIPCLSATLDGKRLGRGGGFYDRFLAHYEGEKILVCLKDMMEPDLPLEPWDQILPLVVNEEGVFDHGVKRNHQRTGD